MKNKYIDLIDQTYYFPQDEFTLDGDELRFHNIDLMELVRQYGAPLKLCTYQRFQRTYSVLKSGSKKPSKNINTKVSITIATAPKVHISNT